MARSRGAHSSTGHGHTGFTDKMRGGSVESPIEFDESDDEGNTPRTASATPEPEMPEPDPIDEVRLADGSVLKLHMSERSNTGYKYVHFHEVRGKFLAQARVQGTATPLSLGYFDTAVEAATAYAKHMLEQAEPAPAPASAAPLNADGGRSDTDDVEDDDEEEEQEGEAAAAAEKEEEIEEDEEMVEEEEEFVMVEAAPEEAAPSSTPARRTAASSRATAGASSRLRGSRCATRRCRQGVCRR